MAKACTVSKKEEADDVSQATASVHDQADDDDATQVGEVLAVEGTSEEQRRSSPLPTKPAAVDRGRTPPVATTTRPATELAGRSRPLVRTPGRTGEPAQRAVWPGRHDVVLSVGKQDQESKLVQWRKEQLCSASSGCKEYL